MVIVSVGHMLMKSGDVLEVTILVCVVMVRRTLAAAAFVGSFMVRTAAARTAALQR